MTGRNSTPSSISRTHLICKLIAHLYGEITALLRTMISAQPYFSFPAKLVIFLFYFTAQMLVRFAKYLLIEVCSDYYMFVLCSILMHYLYIFRISVSSSLACVLYAEVGDVSHCLYFCCDIQRETLFTPRLIITEWVVW